MVDGMRTHGAWRVNKSHAYVPPFAEKLLNRLQEVKAESTSWEESCLRERARAQKLERDLTKLQKKWEMDNNAATVSQMEARVGEMTEQVRVVVRVW